MKSKQIIHTGMQRLYHWCEHGQGEVFMQQEQSLVQGQLETVFGYYLLQIGHYPTLYCDEHSCKVRHHIVLEREAGNKSISLRGPSDALPFATESIDAVILPHTLEFEANPHQILREVERCLMPEGRLIITAFNPASLWLPFRLTSLWRRRLPWQGRRISKSRVKDWMALLGFEVERIESFFYQPPVLSRLARRMGWLEFLLQRYLSWSGAGYMLVAKKRVSTLTPIKPRWSMRPRPLLGLGLTESINSHRETLH